MNSQQNTPEVFHSVRAVVGYARPYDLWDMPYQAYYRTGLKYAMEKCGGIGPKLLGMGCVPPFVRLLRTIRNNSDSILRSIGGASFAPMIDKGIDSLANSFAPQIVGPANIFVPIVGQYLITLADGSVRRICIDAHDSHFVQSETLRSWADVYFKANMWSSVDYHCNVRPIVNGNPNVSSDEDQLCAMRGQTPEYDLCFVVQVRPGSSDEPGIEHCLRLLEALSRLPCRKFLCAVLKDGDIRAQTERLDRCGVTWRTRALPLRTLRRVAARSRLNVIRLGVHQCIPWRMVELLAIGCAISLDRLPLSKWPEPLVAGMHFLDLGLDVKPGHCQAEDTAYESIPARVEGWLAREEFLLQFRVNAARYFDQHASPSSVGAYLLDSCACVG